MSIVPASSLAIAFAPLQSVFGPRLTMRRNGDTVCWMVDGLAAFVEADGKRSVRATFVERATRDSISEATVAPFYRANGYRLTSDGCRRLADDMVAFFSGTREPLFSFVGFRESEFVRS